MDFERVPAAGGSCMVRVAGPDSRHVVLLLPNTGDPADVYDDVIERLHNSDLRTVAVEDIVSSSAADVLAVLDELGLKWVHLVGNGAGADIAWELAARTFGRFASLIVVDRGHPSLPDHDGVVKVPGCAAVEIPTTILVGSSLRKANADASGRMVYGDFRVVQLDGPGDIPNSHTAAFATEIVLRTSPW